MKKSFYIEELQSIIIAKSKKQALDFLKSEVGGEITLSLDDRYDNPEFDIS